MALDATWELDVPTISVGRRGEFRPPLQNEASNLILGALATYGKLATITVGNISRNGRKMAVAIFDDVHFAKEHGGKTHLEQNDGSKSQ